MHANQSVSRPTGQPVGINSIWLFGINAFEVIDGTWKK
jgi:hypothetical protein